MKHTFCATLSGGLGSAEKSREVTVAGDGLDLETALSMVKSQVGPEETIKSIRQTDRAPNPATPSLAPDRYISGPGCINAFGN